MKTNRIPLMTGWICVREERFRILDEASVHTVAFKAVAFKAVAFKAVAFKDCDRRDASEI